ncbi:GMC oxidoreductase [Microvirga massiliensis]|uniref:GMC oxidoreductase n=1 Tax=Microvirga massiliensis TaxID=1033741 RepID=UPI000661483E|nr:GMC oxidoreductase [Microvirga massiliensis]
MPLQSLVPTNSPASFDVQETTFSHDILGRYVCNTWDEIDKERADGGYPFDAVVIGAGMFGAYCAEKLYRFGAGQALRVLLIDAGAFLLPTHIQNLPQRLGGTIGGGPDISTNRDTGFRNVIWRVPWISNEIFPGLAYCIGGRSIFWGGWSPRMVKTDLDNWPKEVVDYLEGVGGAVGAYATVEEEIGVKPSTDYIVKASLYAALNTAFTAAKPKVKVITEIGEAPLAVQGSPPASGLFSFDKFSSGPFLIDAIRHDVGTNGAAQGDLGRRIFLLPQTRVLHLQRSGNAVTGLQLDVDGRAQTLQVPPGCAVVLGNGTIEATRIALNDLGVGDITFGSPRVGNLVAHLRSNITVRIKRSALGLPAVPTEIETTAFLVRGEALGRRFHHQVIASSVVGTNPEAVMWNMVPDIELLDNMLANQNPEWVTIVFRGIGEMEGSRKLAPEPAMSWIDQSPETDDRSVRRAYVNLAPTDNDRKLWQALDKAAFDLADQIAMAPANIEYLTPGGWVAQRPQPDAQGRGFWQDNIGSTHHEAGPLFMGDPGKSITDLHGKFHGLDNVYVAGPAIFPTLGSANPSLAGLALARRTADAIVRATAGTGADGAFAPLSLDPKDWVLVKLDPNAAGGSETTVRCSRASARMGCTST